LTDVPVASSTALVPHSGSASTPPAEEENDEEDDYDDCVCSRHGDQCTAASADRSAAQHRAPSGGRDRGAVSTASLLEDEESHRRLMQSCYSKHAEERLLKSFGAAGE
jgi:hypothetical protein